jgi:hypothetical protein
MHTYTRHLSIETCRAISKKKFTAIFILPRAFLIEGATCRSAMMIAICVCYQLNQETMPSLRLLEIDHFSCLSIFLRITITTILDLIREKFLFFLTSDWDVFDSWTFFFLFAYIYIHMYVLLYFIFLFLLIDLFALLFLFVSIEFFLIEVGGHHVRRTETLKLCVYIYVNKSSNTDGGSSLLVFFFNIFLMWI